jgi:3-oxoacyl-[acyl-carrier protein] reductase
MGSQVVLLTGAASGIGRHFAGALAGDPAQYRLALADVDLGAMGSAFVPGDRLRLHRLDIRSLDDWRRVVDDTLGRFGRIDYLFNIAGGGRPGFLVNQPLENVDLMLDVNLKGPLYGMRLVAERMVQQRSGHIINVASLAGISPTPGNSLYSAAKSGLRAASIAAAIELRRYGVYVTVVCPGVVDTPLSSRHVDFPEETALNYSGGRMLSVGDLELALREAMAKKPLEIDLPRGQARTAKLASAMPWLALKLYPRLKRRGMKRLERMRTLRSGGEPK